MSAATGDARPRFCPHCGTDGLIVAPMMTTDVAAYDCHCTACGWDGDISPEQAEQEGPSVPDVPDVPPLPSTAPQRAPGSRFITQLAQQPARTLSEQQARERAALLASEYLRLADAIRKRYAAALPGSAATEMGAQFVWREIADLVERGEL